ncbi:sulfite exporter TauE/SafE family protein [Flavobacteriaceae bacterium S356]|uniref:Probable membrane transporter protein n=1 Tax=Asprobacillus argus TaxID=3076534 RepID=A0ABU3LIW6_9FLAO|nr:sulfite exporter TauE/SafE family protein [Flavobacteriaceae bacterium S356]
MDFLSLVTVLETHWPIIVLFFAIALLYSSVGFGGGSSYLAVLAFMGIAFIQIRSTALLCNIAVVSGNVLLYQQRKLLDWKRITPLIVFSVPLAYLGGMLQISQTFFFILLGFTLLFAAITMWNSKRIVGKEKVLKKSGTLKNSMYGGIIGFVSGMVGIGGGIFLAPVLHLTHWNTPKKIAATASLFILINSIAGLIGQYSNENFTIDWGFTITLLVTVFIGGQIGSRLSNRYFTAIQLKKATAILIAFVAIRILWKYLF